MASTDLKEMLLDTLVVIKLVTLPFLVEAFSSTSDEVETISIRRKKY